MSKLTNKQKFILSQMSDRAFLRQRAMAHGRAEYFYDDMREAVAKEDFRHREVGVATGKAGLRCCSQADYKLIVGHFEKLLGHEDRALKAFVAAQSDGRRTIEKKITDACKQFGFHLSYADGICRDQNHGQGLDDVGEDILWNVFFTISNRGRAKQRKERIAA